MVIDRLTYLCVQFLEPIRDRFGALHINSGYRSHDLNIAVGGTDDSAHTYGCAADIHAFDSRYTPRDIVKWIVEQSGLDYDQVIEEHTSTSFWCHIGMLRPGHQLTPRKQALMFIGGKYTPWK